MKATRPGFLLPVFASVIAAATYLAYGVEPLELDAQPRPAEVRRAPLADGRVATVIDRQGTALVRPVGRERWSPLSQRDLLMPGDLVRTPARGAHALEVELVTGGKVVLGPGATAEFVAPGQVRLYRGEFEVVAGKGKPAIAVKGPGGFEKAVDGTLIARVVKRETTTLDHAPRWLSGYRESTTDEWVGSLLANVDGREVPLSVGYHKVDAVIRDQIAQTTVEQSFINSTKNRLEGVFYFPLPADASISGFGMWIGGELVEADIIEKQRARQIYEDILRRKKDPGLLEWSGGNLFKARVFPIEPHSEKRIRIRYTQILPLEGATVRYRYALRSELLTQRPLRDLKIKVSVASTMKIEDFASSTHEVRVRKTAHAATIEYDAQEVTPDSDFEARLTLDRGAALTVVPHRRVDDGYFMVSLSPPDGASGKWRRDLMPEGQPIDLLLVADTSASMDVAARRSQADFIRSLLSLLGAKDRFRLMTADVDVQKFSAEPVAVDDESIEKAMAFLATRDSLGWTDLDKILAVIGSDSKAGTVVVYVGDGIGTTGDADPVALARRIGRRGKDCKAVVHAVSTGSTYELGVLEALARIGGGSVRSIGEDAAEVAFALLAESAQPAIKNLKVEFQGVRVARAYPEVLPNLPVGTQQVVLGRFLPTGQDQSGTVLVTGSLAGKPVRYTARFVIKAGETGNSFIPRLWARRHLDALLSQGRTAAVKSDIVGFSQEFGIMTPYSSFLVLENDEDRKRYGVQRRVKMRDGEAFFAKGRDDASTEILRQQMRQAKTYRLQMRLRMLNEIGELGRGLHGWAVAYSKPMSGRFTANTGSREWAGNGRDARRKFGGRRGLGPVSGGMRAQGFAESKADFGGVNEVDKEVSGEFEKRLEMQDSLAMDLPAGPSTPGPGSMSGKNGKMRYQPMAKQAPRSFFDRRKKRRSLSSLRRIPARPAAVGLALFGFPSLPAPYREPKEPRLAKWSPEVMALVGLLDRRERMKASDLGWLFRRRTLQLHPQQGRIEGWSASHGIIAGGDWVIRGSSRVAQPHTSYNFGGDRAGVMEALGVGRKRPSDVQDKRLAFGFADYSTIDFARVYHGYNAKIIDGNRLVVTAIAAGQRRYEFVIDRERRVVTRFQTIDAQGEVMRTTSFSDFVQKGGMYWARKVEQTDSKGRVSSRRSLAVETMKLETTRELVAAEVAKHGEVVFLGLKDPKLDEAKQALHVGKATVADHLRMVTHFYATQQWDRVFAAWAKALTHIEGKPAVPFIRLRLLSDSRRGEEFKQLAGKVVAPWARLCTRPSTTPVGIDFLAATVAGIARKVMSNAEQLTLLETLERVHHRKLGSPDEVARADIKHRDLSYRRSRADLLMSLHRTGDELRLRSQTAAVHAEFFEAARDYIYALTRAGDRHGQVKFLASKVAADKLWTETEIRYFYATWMDGLYQLRDLEAMQRVATAWMAADPENRDPYQRQLAARMFRNQAAEVWREVDRQLATREFTGPAKHARLMAAVQFALGQAWNMSTNHIADRWQKPLASLVRRCTKNGGSQALQVSQQVAGSWYFRRTDAWGQLRRDFATDLFSDAGIPKMNLRQLAVYMQWISWDRNSIAAPEWTRARDLFMARFETAADAGEQAAIGGYVLRVLDAYQAKAEALQFLRKWHLAAKTQPESVSRQLFDRLLSAEWTEAIETEAFALVSKLLPARVEPDQREAQTASSIRHLAEKLSKQRLTADLGPVAELEKLSRQERRERTKTARQRVRKSLARRLGVAADAADEEARRWYRIEQLGYSAEAGDDRQASVAAAIELLKSVPGTGEDREPSHHEVLRERCALIMAYAATRRGAIAAVADAALGLFREQAETNPKSLDWRYQIFRLSIALDRNKSLAAELATWIEPGKADMTWRRTLAFLNAEGGDVRKATKVLEGVESADELTATDYHTLADWYLVLGDDGRRQRALLRHFEVDQEWQLSNNLSALRSKVGRPGGGLTGVVTEKDLLSLQALLTKTGGPRNYVRQIRNAYRSCKDFRILGTLPYGIVGHSSGQIYPFLERIGQVIGEVHEEASCDSLTTAIGRVRESVERDTDRRGLLLLTSIVERRAAKVLNAPGGHMRAALSAMRESFKGDWEPGERAAMASYLASLGMIRHRALADEQMRQLRVLYAMVKPADRLTVAVYLARTQWTYQKHDGAIDTLATALDAYRTRFGGVLPPAAGSSVTTMVSYLRQRKHFARGEKFLIAEHARQELESRKNWYTTQLRSLYIDCIGRHGEVSLGQGEALYLALRKQWLATIWDSSWSVMSPTFSSFCSLHQTAHEHGIDRAGADFNEFAKKVMPELGTRFVLDQANKHRQVADIFSQVDSPTRALEHLVIALENEPPWLRSVNRTYWSTFAYKVSQYNMSSRNAALKRRLLSLVVSEMQRDLRNMRWRNSSIFYRTHRYFWHGAADTFAKTSTDFIAANRGSEAKVLFAANYLWLGLAERDDAISALADLHRRGKLREAGRWTLVRWYDQTRQHQTAQPHITALAKLHPDRLDYRLMEAKVHHEVGEAAESKTALHAIVKNWTDRKKWNEGVMAQLGSMASHCELYALSAKWYEEAVRDNERNGRRRWNWRHSRSGYYVAMARAHGKLGNSDAAIDAASAAVVVWGNDQRNRKNALTALHKVIAQVADLDAYVARWAKKASESGMDAPLIRKHIGQVYLERDESEKAIVQLTIARELQPSDTETHTRLLAAYDRLKDKAGAIACLKASIRMSPMDLDLYGLLASRTMAIGDKISAERAYTSMVEVRPNEAESHRRLAKIRLNQRRAKDAVVQWQQVVRVRAEEPDGWLDLARAQITAGFRKDAGKTLRHVLDTSWEARFKNVHKLARNIQTTLR